MAWALEDANGEVRQREFGNMVLWEFMAHSRTCPRRMGKSVSRRLGKTGSLYEEKSNSMPVPNYI